MSVTTSPDAQRIQSILNALSLPTIRQQRAWAARQQAAFELLADCLGKDPDHYLTIVQASAILAAALDTTHFGFALREHPADPWLLEFGAISKTDGTPEPVSFEFEHDPESSASAFAMENKRMLVIPSLEQETRFSDSQLKEQGIVSTAVCPLIGRHQQAAGTVGVYSQVSHQFNRGEVAFAQAVVRLLSPVCARLQCERALEAQNGFVAQTFDTMESLVILLNAEDRITQANRACQQLTDFTAKDLQGRPLWNALMLPEQSGEMQDAVRRARTLGQPVKVESFVLTSSGERKRVAWTLCALESGRGPGTVIATGVDRTNEHDTLKRLIEAETKAQEAQESAERLSNSAVQASGRERREHNRNPYPTLQSIAPFDGHSRPALSDYMEVRCRDITPGGFSFFLRERPSFSKIIVVFGGGGPAIPLISEIVHVTEIPRDSSARVNLLH